MLSTGYLVGLEVSTGLGASSLKMLRSFLSFAVMDASLDLERSWTWCFVGPGASLDLVLRWTWNFVDWNCLSAAGFGRPLDFYDMYKYIYSL